MRNRCQAVRPCSSSASAAASSTPSGIGNVERRRRGRVLGVAAGAAQRDHPLAGLDRRCRAPPRPPPRRRAPAAARRAPGRSSRARGCRRSSSRARDADQHLVRRRARARERPRRARAPPGPPHSLIRIARIPGGHPTTLLAARSCLRPEGPMTLTVVGSIAFDAVETPSGERDRMLGGAAVHFALASSFFDEMRVVGPVGDDFGDAEYEVLRSRGVVDRRHRARRRAARPSSGGPLRAATSTRATRCRHELNVFEHFEPKLSEASRDADVAVPGQHPARPAARRCASSATSARFVALDSMNLWIDIARDSLVRTIRRSTACSSTTPSSRSSPTSPTSSAPRARCIELGPRRSSSPSRASTAPRCSPTEGFFGLPAYPLETSSTRPAPATRSPAASWASRRPRRRGARRRRCCAARWPTARRSRPSTSRSSAPSACSRLTADEITDRVAELQRITRFEDAPIALTGLALR